MMQNAIELAIQRGWKVFPLIHRSRFSMEQPLLTLATTSIEQVDEWQKQYPGCLWAVATGEDSGVFAVEFSRNSGIQTMRSLCEDDFSAMDTLQIRTSKQVTMFFHWPEVGLPASRRQQIAEGISIRHEGGYAWLPADVEESGGEYMYSNPTESPKDAPGWLLNLAHQRFSMERPAGVAPFPSPKPSTHIVALSFAMQDNRWACEFISMEDGGSIVKTLFYRSARTVLLLAERGGLAMNAANRKWFDASIRNGRGKILLTLTREQYQKLIAA
jgi:hypothetical protein